MTFGKTVTALLVDDYKEFRELEKSLLDLRFDVFYESSTGEEAIKIHDEHKPDWVLMDIKMIGITGIEATSRIIEKHPAAKIIIVTNYDDNNLREAAKKAGALEYVLKENLSGIQKFINNYQGAL